MFFSKTLMYTGDVPGGPMVKNPPANAGDMGSIPGPGRFTCQGATKPMHHHYQAHVLQLLKPDALEPMVCKKRSCGNEKPKHHTPRKPRCSNKGTAQPKINR